MNLEDYLKLAGQSYDLQTRKGQKPIYGQDYYQSEDADEYFVNIPGIGEVNLGFDGTGGKAQLGSGDILGQDGNSQFSSVWSPWTAKDGKATFGNIDTQQEQRSGSWLEENLPMLTKLAMTTIGGMGAYGALGGGAQGAGGWTSGFDLAGGGGLEGMGSSAGFGGSGADMWDFGGLEDYLGGGGDGLDGAWTSGYDLPMGSSGGGWEQFAMGQVPEASVLGTGAGQLSSGPGFLEQLLGRVGQGGQNLLTQLGGKLTSPQGLAQLLGALSQSYNNRGTANDLQSLFAPYQGVAQNAASRLNQTYDNPLSYLEGPEYQAMQRVTGDYLQRQDAAGGRLSNDFGRQAKLQDMAMGNLQQYRNGLQGMFNGAVGTATGSGAQSAVAQGNNWYNPLMSWLGGTTQQQTNIPTPKPVGV